MFNGIMSPVVPLLALLPLIPRSAHAQYFILLNLAEGSACFWRNRSEWWKVRVVISKNVFFFTYQWHNEGI